jgi:exodeoxyribonuclease-3
MAQRCTAARIDREARKGKQPSDHAPVFAEFSDS